MLLPKSWLWSNNLELHLLTDASLSRQETVNKHEKPSDIHVQSKTKIVMHKFKHLCGLYSCFRTTHISVCIFVLIQLATNGIGWVDTWYLTHRHQTMIRTWSLHGWTTVWTTNRIGLQVLAHTSMGKVEKESAILRFKDQCLAKAYKLSLFF
jgi:hypothetical protein